MTHFFRHTTLAVALLITGSAILLSSCRRTAGQPEETNNEGVMTQQSDSLTIIDSKTGKKSYKFKTPLMERYQYAKDPYMEFRRGVYIETYADSTQAVESTLTSQYAIFFELQDLWEAKGDVVATNAKGQVLETQQLFWNRKTKKIYSNIDTKLTQGNDVIIGIGFESDETLDNWEFRNPTGRITVHVDPEARDSSQTAHPVADTIPGNI